MATQYNRLWTAALRFRSSSRVGSGIRRRPTRCNRPFHSSRITYKEAGNDRPIPKTSTPPAPSANVQSKVESKETNPEHGGEEGGAARAQATISATNSEEQSTTPSPHSPTAATEERPPSLAAQLLSDASFSDTSSDSSELADVEQFLENPPDEHRAAAEEVKRELAALEASMGRELDAQIRDAAAGEEAENTTRPARRPRIGFMAMGEDDELDEGEDEVFEGDDMTSMGHEELEKQRELREYQRIIAWEMPQLAKFAKPFVPPTSDQPLRFRYTTYLGESHPAEHKVVMEFCTADLSALSSSSSSSSSSASSSLPPLPPPQQQQQYHLATPAHRLKLIKLLGARYDPQTDLVRMSCEQFPSRAQNRKYLLDLLRTLLVEARCESSEEGGTDAFDDVPVDFRHARPKIKLDFPESWKLTPERERMLRTAWKEDGSLLDGTVTAGAGGGNGGSSSSSAGSSDAVGAIEDSGGVLPQGYSDPGFPQEAVPELVERDDGRFRKPRATPFRNRY